MRRLRRRAARGFQPGAFCTLDKEQLAFLTAFLSCRGSPKDMEKALGISYPTIKNRLESLITALGLQEGAGSQRDTAPCEPGKAELPSGVRAYGKRRAAE